MNCSRLRCVRAVLSLCILALLPCLAFAAGLTQQTIQILPISDQTFGVSPFQVIAIASSWLPVTLTATGPATINGRLLTITGTGTVTISAHQDGNSMYAAADAQQTFHVNPGTPSIQWNPGTIIYGTPLDSTILNASATVIPAADPSADTTTVTWQLTTSQITGGKSATVPASSPIFRWEGAPNVEVSPYTPDWGGLIPDPTLVRNHLYRVAFTCDCQQFEFVIQARQGNYRLWVDGAWTTPTEVPQVNDYPDVGFCRVQFPDKRARQIKVALTDITPFYGVVTSASDTISPPQTPLGPKAVVFGDSWTGPTIIQPLLLPAQPGGSGYAQLLGEYFNWDWREDGLGSTGFVNPGTFGITFPQRALTDICGRDPDLVVVMGGVNDGGQTESAVEGAVTTFLSELQTCVPNTRVLLFGPQEPLPNVADGMAAAAAKFVSNVSYYPSAQTWIYGQSNDTTTGNAYIYINGHPTPLGHAYWSEQMVQTILGAFPTMTPQTFALFDGAPAAGSISYSVTDKSLLPVGQHTLSATFTPQDNVNYTTATQNAVLTVAKASSSIALSSSVSSIAPGKTFTLQSTVSPQIGGVPTGAVTFMDNGNPIGNAALGSTGSAAFSTAALTTGTHLITASYPGDGNFLPSATTAPVSVLIANPDFSFTLGTTALTVLPSQSRTTKVTVHPVAGLVAGLMLSCSGLPANASCSLQNASQIAVNQQDIAATVVVQAYALKAQADRGLPGLSPNLPGLNLPGLGLSGLTGLKGTALCGIFGLFFFLKRKNRDAFSQFAAALLLFFAGISFISGCGSGAKINTPQPGTYAVQVTLSNAADASMTHSQTIQVTIP